MANQAWQLIILSHVVYHNGRQSKHRIWMPHDIPTKRWACHSLKKYIFSFAEMSNSMTCSVKFTNRSTKRSLAYNCKHGKVKEERRCWFSFFFLRLFRTQDSRTLYAHFGGAYNIFPEVRRLHLMTPGRLRKTIYVWLWAMCCLSGHGGTQPGWHCVDWARAR